VGSKVVLLKVALPRSVVLVYPELEVFDRGEAEAQVLAAGLLVGVPAPLLGLECLPQRDSLAGGVPAPDPDEALQVG
jgi:hypothetical protein